MRIVAVVSGLIGLLACGNDETTASAEACAEGGGDGCFVLPRAAIRAVDPSGNPRTLTLDCPAYQVTTATRPITLQGKTTDIFARAEVGGVRVEGFSDREMTNSIADTMSNNAGSFALTVDPMPSELFMRVSADGRLMTHMVGTRWDVTVASQTNLVFETNTPASVATALGRVGQTLQAKHGQVFSRIFDCANNHLVNAVGNISPTSGKQEFVDEVRSYYVFIDTLPAPTLAFRTELSETTTSGGVAFINVPAGTYYLQAWGFLSDREIANGLSGLTLLGETKLIVPSVGTEMIAPLFTRN